MRLLKILIATCTLTFAVSSNAAEQTQQETQYQEFLQIMDINHRNGATGEYSPPQNRTPEERLRRMKNILDNICAHEEFSDKNDVNDAMKITCDAIRASYQDILSELEEQNGQN